MSEIETKHHRRQPLKRLEIFLRPDQVREKCASKDVLTLVTGCRATGDHGRLPKLKGDGQNDGRVRKSRGTCKSSPRAKIEGGRVNHRRLPKLKREVKIMDESKIEAGCVNHRRLPKLNRNVKIMDDSKNRSGM
jgi:hypothetical protein